MDKKTAITLLWEMRRGKKVLVLGGTYQEVISLYWQVHQYIEPNTPCFFSHSELRIGTMRFVNFGSSGIRGMSANVIYVQDNHERLTADMHRQIELIARPMDFPPYEVADIEYAFGVSSVRE